MQVQQRISEAREEAASTSNQAYLILCAERDQQREAMRLLIAENEAHKSRSEGLERRLEDTLKTSANAEASHVRFSNFRNACLSNSKVPNIMFSFPMIYMVLHLRA